MVANICDILFVDETRERRVDVASDGPPSLLLSYDSESLGRDGSVTLPITFQTGSDNREFLKRAHDVGAFESFEDRRRKSAKLDEQLECLQSVLPCSTKMSKERTSVVSDAYRYIGTLQRQLEELKAQVPEEAYSARTHPKDYESREMLDQRNCSRQQCESLERCPMVEVVKRDGLLEVCIVCVNRPGLLVDVMSAVESRSFDVVQVRIACHDDIVVEYLSLESEDSLSSYSAEVEKDITSEEDSVKAMFVHAICKEGFDCVL